MASEPQVHQLAPDHYRKFLLAGEAIVTLVSKKTNVRFTYRVSRQVHRNGKYPWIYFLAYLTGPNNLEDYTYLGILNPVTGVIAKSKASPQRDPPALVAAR